MPFKGPPLEEHAKIHFRKKGDHFFHTFLQTQRLNPKSRRKHFFPEPFERYWVFLFVTIHCMWNYSKLAVVLFFFTESGKR